MPSKSEIIEALQMGIFYSADAINGTDDAAFTVTYQFEDSLPDDDFSGLTGWGTWTNAEKNAVVAALEHIETFLNVDFVEVTNNADADLSLGLTNMSAGLAGLGGASLATWSDGSFYDYDGFAAYDKTLDITENANLILHELGHALGLDHPFEGVALDTDYDTNHYTVMSYTADPESGEHNDAMMLYDVFALQEIWGAAAYNTGDTTYTGPRTDNVDTIWDTGGTDTLDAAARSTAVVLDLQAGAFSTFGEFEDVSIAHGVTIENAAGGSGDDIITGNAADNALQGNDGDDTIKGKAGRDTILGGHGGDQLKGGSGKDALKGMAGADQLDGGSGADALTGGGGGDQVRGGNGKDALKGGGGNDKLYGGNGDDWLRGGSGEDKLWGDDGADTFCFAVGADKDVVKDFESGIDTLEIAGLGTRAEVLALAEESNGAVTFDFGGGDLLVVKNMTLDALETDLLVS